MLVLAAAVAGCGGDEEAPRTLPTLPSASPSAAAVPSPPAEALAETPQGASAFARYYFADLVNAAYKTQDTSAVEALSHADCGSCANVVKDVQRLKAAGTKVAGQRFKISFAEAAPAAPDGTIVVDFRFSSDPYKEVGGDGEVVREEPAQVDQDAQVKLRRQAGSWVVVAIRTV